MSNGPRIAERAGPLSGVTVLEIGGAVAEHAGLYLAELGALVIKVEPHTGARSRGVGPYAGMTSGQTPTSLAFWARNVAKLSVRLDVNQNDGMRVLRRLVEQADVVLEGRDDVRVLSGCMSEHVAAWKPSAIHCVVSPFGEDSPWSDKPWSELTALALGGIAGVSGYGADEILDGYALPIAPAGVHAASMGGALAVIGIITELIERKQNKQPRPVEVALHDAIAVSTEFAVPSWSFGEAEVDRHTGRHATVGDSPIWNLQCQDGRYLCAIPLYMNDKRFAQLLGWLISEGCADDLGEERFRDQVVREAEMQHIMEVVGTMTARHTADDMFHGAQARGLAWAPILSPDELVTDEYLRERGFYAELATKFGQVAFPGVPYKGMDSVYDTAGVDLTPPELGEDSHEVLRWLGYSPAEIQSLVQVGAV
jgi:crotonobetainyl-CoA:carnitine CoA-transferase CaiB-like acyl-CoA transferase